MNYVIDNSHRNEWWKMTSNFDFVFLLGLGACLVYLSFFVLALLSGWPIRRALHTAFAAAETRDSVIHNFSKTTICNPQNKSSVCNFYAWLWLSLQHLRRYRVCDSQTNEDDIVRVMQTPELFDCSFHSSSCSTWLPAQQLSQPVDQQQQQSQQQSRFHLQEIHILQLLVF